jgi:hypothetical protein
MTRAHVELAVGVGSIEEVADVHLLVTGQTR